MSVEEKRALISELLRKYQDGLALGDSLNETEFQYSDPYAYVATHLHIDLYNKTGDKCYLLEALAIANVVLKGSEKNYLMRLLVLKIHTVLGAIDMCTDMYTDLEIKYLQAESLSYVIERPVLTLGLSSAFQLTAKNCQVLHRSNRRDTSDYIETAYKNGNFEKVVDMVSFKNKLSSSCYRKSTDLCSLLYSWIDGMSNPKLTELRTHLPSFESWFDVVKDMETEVYTDTRDFGVLDDFSPSNRRFTDTDIKETFNADCIWIRVRRALITCIGSLVEACLLHAELEGSVTTDTKDGAANEGTVRWEELCSLFEKGLESFDKEIESAIVHPLFAMAAQSNTAFSLAKLRSPQLPMLELLITPNKNARMISCSFRICQSLLRSVGEPKSIEVDLEGLAVSLREIMAEISSEEYILELNDKIFLSVEKITTFLFTISIINVCLICVYTLSPHKSKRSKKAKQSKPEISEHGTALNNFIASTLLPVCKQLQNYVTNALAYYNDMSVEVYVNTVLNILPDDEPLTTSISYEVRKRPILELVSSYISSLEKIGFVIENRIKLLEQI